MHEAGSTSRYPGHLYTDAADASTVSMKILVVGGGCREHIIAERLSSEGNAILSAMKNRNPGISRLSDAVLQCDETAAGRIAGFAREKGADFVVVGPENPLQAGIADELASAGIPCFGPGRDAAEIESSKSFARGLLSRHGIPGNPEFASFDSESDAVRYIRSCGHDVVVKPSGLTGGKGVKVVGEQLRDNAEACEYVGEIFNRGIGGAGVVIEERLRGEEFSLQAVSDGKRLLPFPLAQDHKRAHEGDTGPNTGGMGSYSISNGLLPFVNAEDRNEALCIMQRTLAAMRSEGREFRGLLYGGFMLTDGGVKLIEYNARFADPESMNVIAVARGGLTDVLCSAADGSLSGSLSFEHTATVCRYYVPHGYGDRPVKGSPITVDEEKIAAEGVKLYYGSVNEKGGKLTTTTSRSFALLAKGDEPWDAAARIERAGQHIGGLVYTRKDIGTREEMQRKRSAGEALHRV